MQYVPQTRLLRALVSLTRRYMILAVTLCISCAMACSAGAPGEEIELGDQREALTAVFRINCGGGAVSPFSGDQYASGGTTWADNISVSTTGVANAAPAAVYGSERYGNFTYTFDGLTAGASYTVRLHFAETHYTTTGARVFNVVVNGASALSNFDIV